MLLQLISECHWIVSTLLQQQLFSGLNKASLKWHQFSKILSRRQSLPLNIILRQLIFPSFWRWLLHSLSSNKNTSLFLNFTVLFQEVQLLLMYSISRIWYPLLCIICNNSNITLMHSNWCCMWLVCTNHIVDSCNLVLLLELLYLLQWHLSDLVYKLLQCSFILIYVIKYL